MMCGEYCCRVYCKLFCLCLWSLVLEGMKMMIRLVKRGFIVVVMSCLTVNVFNVFVVVVIVGYFIWVFLLGLSFKCFVMVENLLWILMNFIKFFWLIFSSCDAYGSCSGRTSSLTSDLFLMSLRIFLCSVLKESKCLFLICCVCVYLSFFVIVWYFSWSTTAWCKF